MNAKSSANTKNKVRKASNMIEALKAMSDGATAEPDSGNSKASSRLRQINALGKTASGKSARASKKRPQKNLGNGTTTIATWAHGIIVNDLNDSSSSVSLYKAARSGEVNVNKDWLSKEVDFLRGVENKHVVRVYEYDNSGGIARTEKVQSTLESKLVSAGHISQIAARRLLMEMLEALSAYHDQKLIHGELDCDKILVSLDARYLLAGSPGFKPNREFRLPGVDRCIAPELLNPAEFGQPCAATDLYCLGHVILKAALGARYFEAIKSQQTRETSQFSIAQWHGSNVDRFPPLIEYLSDAPDLYPVLEKMIRKNVSERYADIRSVQTDLERLTFDQSSGTVGMNSNGKVARPIQTKRQKSKSVTLGVSTSSDVQNGSSRTCRFLVSGLAAACVVGLFAMTSSSSSDASKAKEIPTMLDLGHNNDSQTDSGSDKTTEVVSSPPTQRPEFNTAPLEEGISLTKELASGWLGNLSRRRKRVKVKREEPVKADPPKVIEQPSFGPETEFVTPVLGLNRRYLTKLEGRDKAKYEQLVSEIFHTLTKENWDKTNDLQRVFALFNQAKDKYPQDLRLPLLVSFGLELHRHKDSSLGASIRAVQYRDQFLQEHFVDADLWLALAPSLQRLRLLAKSKRRDDISRTVDQCIAFTDELQGKYRSPEDIEAAKNAARLIACVFHRLEFVSKARNYQTLDRYVLQIERGFKRIDPRIAISFTSCRDMLKGDDQRLEFLEKINGYVEMRSIMQSYSAASIND